jgi:APA family basic amino acid/polyamine antiporter
VSEDGGAHPLDRLRRELRLSDAVFLVVASVIGSGIFFTPGQVAALLPHPGWILAAWLAGGVISLAGALANAELGAMFPRAGGDYVYLREGVHPAAGFMVGWLTFGIIYTGTIAAVAAALAEAIAGPLGWSESATVALAIAATLACSALNFVGVRWGALANNITSIVKIAALLAFALLGPTIGDGQWSRVVSAPEQGGGEVTIWAFGLSMSPILFSYLGWNATIYVASEIREPGRNVPRSLFRGLGICTTVYLLVNAVYLYALPMTELRGVGDAGSAAAFALFGPVSATLVSLFVLISILGTLNATVLVGPRIAYAMALDGLFVGGAHRVTEARRRSRAHCCWCCAASPTRSTSRPSRSCSRPSPTCGPCSGCGGSSPTARGPTGRGATPGCRASTRSCAAPSRSRWPSRIPARARSRSACCWPVGPSTPG